MKFKCEAIKPKVFPGLVDLLVTGVGILKCRVKTRDVEGKWFNEQ